MIFHIYGESNHDRQSIKNFILAIVGAEGTRTRLLREPIVLRRDVQPRKKVLMYDTIASFWRAGDHGNGGCVVVVHRDRDAVEPAHIQERTDILAELNNRGVTKAVAAVPAWEIETWLMLFPEALARARGCWRRVNYRRRNVGLIANAKEQLVRDLKPIGGQRGRCPDYTESDSVDVSAEVAKDPSMLAVISPTSNSFISFKSDLESL